MTEASLDPRVRAALERTGVAYEVLVCDPALADAAAFCDHYGFPMEQAANTLVVSSRKVEPRKVAVCVVLGISRLDVNHRVSELLQVKRLSFADAEVTMQLTGMMIGGVTAFGIEGLPIYVDAAVMEQGQVVMGGGNRSSKVLIAPTELLKLPEVEVVSHLALPRPT